MTVKTWLTASPPPPPWPISEKLPEAAPPPAPTAKTVIWVTPGGAVQFPDPVRVTAAVPIGVLPALEFPPLDPPPPPTDPLAVRPCPPEKCRAFVLPDPPRP